jgi:hypothetical protein
MVTKSTNVGAHIKNQVNSVMLENLRKKGAVAGDCRITA